MGQAGVDALKEQGFTPAMLSVLAKDDPQAAALIETVFGAAPERVEVPVLATTVVRGSLLGALQGAPATSGGPAWPRPCAGSASSRTTA